MAQIGFDAINFNGAACVVDSHVASGSIWGLNTKRIKLIMHEKRDFYFTGFKIPLAQDAIVGQILWAGNLVNSAPRLNFQMRGLS